MGPIGVGLIGMGRWGRNYLHTLLQLHECRLVAVADPDPGALTIVPPPIDRFALGEELVDHPMVEAVIIATPDSTHYRLARAALESGRDVLVEKPVATSVDDAEELDSLAAAGNAVLAVGHTALYHPGFQRVRASVADGSIGSFTRLTAVRTSAGVQHRTSCVLQDLVPHDLAMTIALAGRPVACRAHTRRDSVSYQVLLPDDVMLSGWSAWRRPPHSRRLRVNGTTGTALFVDAPADKQAGIATRDTPLGRQCLDFINSCRNRTTPQSDSRLGLEVTRTIAALAESIIENGSWIRFLQQPPNPVQKPESETCIPAAIS